MNAMHGRGGWMGGMVLFWVAVLITSAWAIYRLTRPSRTPHLQSDRQHHAQPSPIEILERRLADGDLTVAEYSDRRARLEHDSQSGT